MNYQVKTLRRQRVVRDGKLVKVWVEIASKERAVQDVEELKKILTDKNTLNKSK